MTKEIGRMLVSWYGMGGHVDKQWEITKFYNGVQKNCELPHIEDVEKYTAMLQDKRYSVFISAMDDCTANLKESVIQNMRHIGLQASLQRKSGCSYLAIVSDGKIVEKNDFSELQAEGTIRDGKVMYELLSAGNACGNASSIKIDGIEYSKNCRGLNIVVYNNQTKTIVDSVCFDTHDESSRAVR